MIGKSQLHIFLFNHIILLLNYLAAHNCYPDIIRILLAAGADQKIKNAQQITAFELGKFLFLKAVFVIFNVLFKG